MLQQSNLYMAQLQVAALHSAKLQGADLGGAQLHGVVGIANASLLGASVKECDLSDAPKIMVHLKQIYGDKSVSLPAGIRSNERGWPSHWSTRNLKWDNYIEAWTNWQATLPTSWDKDRAP